MLSPRTLAASSSALSFRKKQRYTSTKGPLRPQSTTTDVLNRLDRGARGDSRPGPAKRPGLSAAAAVFACDWPAFSVFLCFSWWVKLFCLAGLCACQAEARLLTAASEGWALRLNRGTDDRSGDSEFLMPLTDCASLRSVAVAVMPVAAQNTGAVVRARPFRHRRH